MENSSAQAVIDELSLVSLAEPTNPLNYSWQQVIVIDILLLPHFKVIFIFKDDASNQGSAGLNSILSNALWVPADS